MPEDRVVKVAETVQTLEATRAASEWTVNRDPYWQRINGLIFGDNPREGVVRGREFIHPELRFRVRFPEGWTIENGKQQVAAAPPGVSDVTIVLELVPNPSGSTLEDVAVRSMEKAGLVRLRGEATKLNGLPAYLGLYEGQIENAGIVRVQAAYISYERQMYLLAGVVSRSRHLQYQQLFDDTLRSFAPISTQDAARIKPNRLAFTTVRSGDTWQGVADRTGGLIPATELAVLNGFAANSQPPVGQRIKIVIASE
jgi:predicted Zn-dependent protease